MLKLRKVAVVGVLGSGKSTVCQIFERLGAYCISTDAIVHRLLSPQTEVGHKVIDLLGQQIVVHDQIDRDRVAERVFKDAALLEAFEKIIHPEVLKELERTLTQISGKSFPLYVVEVPLLYESGLDAFFDTVIVVVNAGRGSRESKNIVMKEERKKRMLPQTALIEKADFVLPNEGSIDELKVAVQKLFNQLKM